jgi:hypothetical protein
MSLRYFRLKANSMSKGKSLDKTVHKHSLRNVKDMRNNCAFCVADSAQIEILKSFVD